MRPAIGGRNYNSMRASAPESVFRSQRFEVSQLVARDVEGQASHRRFVPIDLRPPRARLSRQTAKQSERAVAHDLILVQEILQWSIFRLRIGREELLVETGERRAVAARNTQKPVREDPLVVGEMAEDI